MKVAGILLGILATSAVAVFGWSMFGTGAGESASNPDRIAAHYDAPGNDSVHQLMDRLRPLHRRLETPRPGDWLNEHDEPGQSYDQYVAGNPNRALGTRRVLYIQPVGDFTPTQRKIVSLTADFMSRYFCLPVKVKKDLPLSKIPQKARRVHPSWGMPQILTTYVLDEVLAPQLPGDAAALIAFTASDLWAGPDWNFVFGQASLRDRVGVWSIYRNGDPEQDDAGFRLCLVRTLKTATHETGHMFSMRHCTAYECNMCGANHREESDRRPLEVCPECVAKVWHATGADPLKRVQMLEDFCRTQNLDDEAAVYQKSGSAIRAGRSERSGAEVGE